MSYYKKEAKTVFDRQPIPGLFFQDGDYLASALAYIFTKGHKVPMIMHDSGFATKLLERKGTDTFDVHIFGEIYLPYCATRGEAFIQAQIQADLTGMTVVKVNDNKIEIIGKGYGYRAIVTYDNAKRTLVNVEYPEVKRPPTEYGDNLQ